MPEGFYEYIPQPKPEMIKVEPGVTQAAVEARRKRIREKEAAIARVIDTVPGGPMVIAVPSGSCRNLAATTPGNGPTDHLAATAADRNKKRRIIGKQNSMMYPLPNVQVKRKANEQDDSGIRRKSRPTVEATKSLVNSTGKKRCKKVDLAWRSRKA